MKRGFESSEDENSSSEDRNKLTKFEFTALEQALSNLKGGDAEAWNLAELFYTNHPMKLNFSELCLAYEAALAGRKQAWNFIYHRFVNQNTQGHFEALETYLGCFYSLNRDKRYALHFNQLSVISGFQVPHKRIPDDTEIENLKRLMNTGLQALFNQISIAEASFQCLPSRGLSPHS